MRFLVDQDVYAKTVRVLQGLGHDVVTAAEIGLARSTDAELLKYAQTEGRILVTRDRDFGGLTSSQGAGGGIIFLRVLPPTQESVHSELNKTSTAA